MLNVPQAHRPALPGGQRVRAGPAAKVAGSTASQGTTKNQPTVSARMGGTANRCFSLSLTSPKTLKC